MGEIKSAAAEKFADEEGGITPDMVKQYVGSIEKNIVRERVAYAPERLLVGPSVLHTWRQSLAIPIWK